MNTKKKTHLYFGVRKKHWRIFVWSRHNAGWNELAFLHDHVWSICTNQEEIALT